MKILYLDTSSSFLYCGLYENNEKIFEIKDNLGKRMSEEVLFKLNQKFEENDISTDSVEKIILVNGPGSFTGVRIGITIAKIYSLLLHIPIITISSLFAMSLSSQSNVLHVPLIDARRGYVYSAIYDSNSNTILNDCYISIEQLNDKLSKLNKEYVFISNDSFDFSVEKYDPNIKIIIEKCSDFPVVDINLVNAKYLKSTEAEEKKNASWNR